MEDLDDMDEMEDMEGLDDLEDLEGYVTRAQQGMVIVVHGVRGEPQRGGRL